LPDDASLNVVVDIPPQFADYLDVALVRLQAILPDCQLAKVDRAISAHGPESLSREQVRKTILHTVYREKIYAETLPMRHALVEAVTTR
jgi:hypothetical protein